MASKDEQSRAIDPVPVARAREQRPALRRRGQRLWVWVAWVAARTTGQFASLMLLGLAFGAAQALALGRQQREAEVDPRVLWVAVSAKGGVVGFVLGGAAASMIGEGLGHVGNSLPTLTFGVVLGTAIGAAQWLVLRQFVHRAGWRRRSRGSRGRPQHGRRWSDGGGCTVWGSHRDVLRCGHRHRAGLAVPGRTSHPPRMARIHPAG